MTHRNAFSRSIHSQDDELSEEPALSKASLKRQKKVDEKLSKIQRQPKNFNTGKDSKASVEIIEDEDSDNSRVERLDFDQAEN